MKINYLSVTAFLILVSSGCYAESTDKSSDINSVSSIDELYGVWVISNIEKYRGGITTEIEASSLINKEVIISKSKFNFAGDNIYNPKYKYSHIVTVPEEGVVLDVKTTAFYGYKDEREYVDLFSVYEDGSVYMNFEVLGTDSLIVPDDGWIYMLKKIKNKNKSIKLECSEPKAVDIQPL